MEHNRITIPYALHEGTQYQISKTNPYPFEILTLRTRGFLVKTSKFIIYLLYRLVATILTPQAVGTLMAVYNNIPEILTVYNVLNTRLNINIKRCY